MSNKPLTAAAAIMVANNSRPGASSPAASTPAPANKHHGSQMPLTELEHEVPVDSLTVDSLTVMKIIKHARELNVAGSSSLASGQLLGLDSAGVLNISDAFPLPPGSLTGGADSEERRGSKAAARYTSSILPRLSALGADANIVGFYCSTVNGQHLSIPGFIETLVSMQIDTVSNPAPKSVRFAPGAKKSAGGKGVALVYDVTSPVEGTLNLKAYRLSKNFIETYQSGRFDSRNLSNHKLATSNFVEEVPFTIQSSALLTAFLATLIASSSDSNSTKVLNSSWGQSYSGSYKLADYLPSIEVHNTALSTLSFQSRQLARDRARLESVIVKRKAENETRAQQGLPPLPPSAEEAALQEPSRLETMCALSGVDCAAKKLNEASGLGVVRAFGAKAGVQ
ncbi:hypothetical protein PPACK8108_LOCUS26026 [Phakopsora pachyrhizi]|uniref:Eukaryotic translation initiation factor 3 subunit H n=1 Tax=Phakopsora pachyrhizi TaxID=170000 RepID=A0AAV0BUT3_PHAPC|nr:hypothetical protein PPACK8108_LOCUS26026 [Phakopsora pachyrhizi]